jgi:hypothetical protein
MKYIFVDKNFLVPVVNETTYNMALNTLINTITNKNSSYINNVYIVVINSTIFHELIYAKDNFIYQKINNNVKKLFNYTKINTNYSFNNNVFINNYFDYDQNNSNDEIVIINNSNINNINNINNNVQDDNLVITEEMIKEDEKRKEILKACEEVMDLYTLEEHKMKKLELNLKSLNNKIEKFKKIKNDKIFNNITKIKNDYRTWKKLKYVINNNDDLLKDISELEKTEIKNIPILFLAKYNYIDNTQENVELSKLFFKINNLDLEKIFMNNDLSNLEDVIIFSEKYNKLLKKLHYKFDHDWDYLDEQDSTTSNNSLFAPVKN